MVAAGTVIESLQVSSQGQCASRALYHDALGFNLQRQPAADGRRYCEVTNTVTGCFSSNLEQRAGWDYYLSGRQGQNEPTTRKSSGRTVSTYVSNPGDFPAELSGADPAYRWGADCNGAADTPEKGCSQYVMTGFHNDRNPVNDLDYIRCYM